MSGVFNASTQADQKQPQRQQLLHQKRETKGVFVEHHYRHLVEEKSPIESSAVKGDLVVKSKQSLHKVTEISTTTKAQSEKLLTDDGKQQKHNPVKKLNRHSTGSTSSSLPLSTSNNIVKKHNETTTVIPSLLGEVVSNATSIITAAHQSDTKQSTANSCIASSSFSLITNPGTTGTSISTTIAPQNKKNINCILPSTALSTTRIEHNHNIPLVAFAAVFPTTASESKNFFNYRYNRPPSPIINNQGVPTTSLPLFPPSPSLVSHKQQQNNSIKCEPVEQPRFPSLKAQPQSEANTSFAVPALPTRPRPTTQLPVNKSKHPVEEHTKTREETNKVEDLKQPTKEIPDCEKQQGDIVKEERTNLPLKKKVSDEKEQDGEFAQGQKESEEKSPKHFAEVKLLVDILESEPPPSTSTVISPLPISADQLFSETKEFSERKEKQTSIEKAQLTSIKPVRLVLRVSAAAVVRLRKLAQYHTRPLRTLGITSVAFDANSSGQNQSTTNFLHIPARTPSPEVAKRHTRLQLIRQQQQLLVQRTQQHFAAIQQQQKKHQRSHQQHQQTQSATANLNQTQQYKSDSNRLHSPQAQPVISQDRIAPQTPAQPAVIPQTSKQHRSQLLDQTLQSTTTNPPPPYFQRDSNKTHQPQVNATFVAHMEQQQIGQSINSNIKTGMPSAIAATPSPAATTTTSTHLTGGAENSPLLVNLLSNNASQAPQQQQPQTNQQQQAMFAAQQQQIAMQQQQQRYAAMPIPPQQSQPPFVGSPMNPQQQQLYQQQIQQQRVQQQQQQQQQQAAMMYGNAQMQTVSHPGMMLPASSNAAHPQHYMIMGPAAPTLPQQNQFRLGMPMQCSTTMSQGNQTGLYYGIGPVLPHMMPVMGPNTGGTTPVKGTTPGTAVNLQTSGEEPPKKRKRTSKKQQQKDEREQKEQQLRMQQEQQQQAMIAMQMRQQQQMAYMQQQQQRQMMAMGCCGGSVNSPMQMPNGQLGPSPPQGMMPAPGMIHYNQAQYPHYQQNVAQYQQQQQYAPTAQTQQQVNQRSTQPQMSQKTTVSAGFNSPSNCSYGTKQLQPQQTTSTTPTTAGPSVQQQYAGSGHSVMGYMMSPQQQQSMGWTSSNIQISQNPTMPFDYHHHLQQQQHPMPQTPQQAFRTPGTPQYYGQSPAATTGGGRTPFQSPPPQMVGTPGTSGTGGHNTPGGHLTPTSCSGQPTPPYGNSGAVCQSTGPSPVYQHQLQQQVHTPQQYHQNQIGAPLGATSQSSVQHPVVPQQQMSPTDLYNQQPRFIIQPQQQPSGPLSVISQQQTAQQNNYSQLSDFADGTSLGDNDELAVPGISSEGLDDFDLDSIEPMRYGEQQQAQCTPAQTNPTAGYSVNQSQQQITMNVYADRQILFQQRQSVGGASQNYQFSQRQATCIANQVSQHVKPEPQQKSSQQCQQQQDKDILISAEQRQIAAEMAMLPDRSPQFGDIPLSPSKLSETQDKNVSDAIASVMERVAKTGNTATAGNSKSTSRKNKGTSKRGSQSSTGGNGPAQIQQQHQATVVASCSSGGYNSSSISRTPTPQTPGSSNVNSMTTIEQHEQKGVHAGLGQIGNGPSGARSTYNTYSSFGIQSENISVAAAPIMTNHQTLRDTTAMSSVNGKQLFHAQTVQQVQADSSTSVSTTLTTASSFVGVNKFSQFNGNFHAPASVMQPRSYTPSSSMSPPTERKTPLSAPVKKTNEPPRFNAALTSFMDTSSTLAFMDSRADRAESVNNGKQLKYKRNTGANDGKTQQVKKKGPKKSSAEANIAMSNVVEKASTVVSNSGTTTINPSTMQTNMVQLINNNVSTTTKTPSPPQS